MKKDRNTFFQESQFMQATFPNQGMNMNVANQPFATSGFSNQGFYAGPQIAAMPSYYTTQVPQNTDTDFYNDIESRISKLERQINRIDARLNKLENNSFYTTEDMETNNNIYMV